MLRPGMYIRTRDGYIRYIIDIIFPRDKNPEWFLLLDGKPFDTRDLAEIGKNIAKYSFNLIDLIEVGDYANGYKVIDVGYNVEEEKYIRLDKGYDGLGNVLYNCDIKAIVTKEQFENGIYAVGD